MPQNPDNAKHTNFFDDKSKTKEKIKEYTNKEPLYDEDYIEKQLQDDLLKEREETDEGEVIINVPQRP